MRITEKSLRVADKIVEILIKEKCTISEAKDILRSIAHDVETSSMVQMKESYTELFSEALEEQS